MSRLKTNDIEARIIVIRRESVLMDADVAAIYGVTTKEVNQAVANNTEKFPAGYILELPAKKKQEVVKKFDNLKTLNFSPPLPKAFSERGLYMLATIIKSDVATQTTLGIIAAFAKIRELSRTIRTLSRVPDEVRQKSLMQRSGEIVSELFDDEFTANDTETSIELNFAV